jgi:hypothetical protein
MTKVFVTHPRMHIVTTNELGAKAIIPETRGPNKQARFSFWMPVRVAITD